jgi:thiol-disulfide isomerase/thioredoxin
MIVLTVLAGCRSGGEPQTANVSQTPAREANEDVEALQQNAKRISGNLPADFQITMYQGTGFQDGDEVMFSELLAEGKPVVLNFWAGLCPPCRLEMPDLQAVSDEYQNSILLFGLDVGPFTALGTREDGRALLDELEITYPAGTTFDGNVVREYEVRGMPTTYFILSDGQVFETWTGLLTRDKLTEIVEEMLVAAGS